ncbi:thiolase family protein [Aquabacterium sp. A08]|uniref:thiolase family protein n=1 Tax=Aquabacterium sp. A08 TaxID=2718532 RepID=UPI001422E396|nr:thiolase family protein [Aquabacterium sp. A08]NIC43358.1 thiolase family protein [Aquabacterium sp. A08]
MLDGLALIAGWARSPVAPRGGALAALTPHQLAAPVLQALLQRAGLPPAAVDAVVLGNALGAGGNPARLVALAAGLPERCAALTVDTQCCAGLDALAVGVGLLASGQASVVVVGGVEAWSRAPLRAHRPLSPSAEPVPYERPAFAPDPAHDPDMLVSAARHAAAHGVARAAQEHYALLSHARALAQRAALRNEIVPVAGLDHDAYPRPLTPARAARMPALRPEAHLDPDQATALTALTVSAQADGAALVLLASPAAVARWGLSVRARWRASASVGGTPDTPLLAAERAATEALRRAGLAGPAALHTLELHDAFAVQGLDFCQRWGLDPAQLNRRGGGLARGHPIGASAAVALVRVLADLWADGRPGDLGLAAVAGAGGLGAAAVVQRG